MGPSCRIGQVRRELLAELRLRSGIRKQCLGVAVRLRPLPLCENVANDGLECLASAVRILSTHAGGMGFGKSVVIGRAVGVDGGHEPAEDHERGQTAHAVAVEDEQAEVGRGHGRPRDRGAGWRSGGRRCMRLIRRGVSGAARRRSKDAQLQAHVSKPVRLRVLLSPNMPEVQARAQLLELPDPSDHLLPQIPVLDGCPGRRPRRCSRRPNYHV